jgi:HAMP domain-containing protein
MASIKKLNDFISKNPAFQKELSFEIGELNEAVNRMVNDLLK